VKYLPLQLDFLLSEWKGQMKVDYSRLQDLLLTQEWEEADIETKEIMIEIAGRKSQGFLDRQSSEKFPYQELYTIDRLWVIHSKGHFGFSIQKHILQSICHSPHFDREISKSGELHLPINMTNLDSFHCRDQFASSVGWRIEGKWLHSHELIFDLSAPQGHLPSPRIAAPSNLREGGDKACQETVGRWCGPCCFGSVWCGLLFFGWWSILDRIKIN
jgi:hypothetical protein